jgi:hypothetical protein
MKAPVYASDPRVLRWVQAGISDPDLKEAYERATTDSSDMLTDGILDIFVTEAMREGDKAGTAFRADSADSGLINSQEKFV